MLLYFESCPRCKGTVIHEEDEHDTALRCLNCGWSADTVTPSPQYVRESVKS